MSEFAQNFAVGQVGESLISRWLQKRGHAVFPAYQIEQHTGKGPQLFTSGGDLVLPDLLAFKAGKILWFEAKHKTCFTWYRKEERWETGIDLRHYGEYQQVAERTSLPVWLLFFHPNSRPSDSDLFNRCPPECPTGLFGGEINELGECESHRTDKYGPSGMVYWAHDVLRFLASADDLVAADG